MLFNNFAKFISQGAPVARVNTMLPINVSLRSERVALADN